MRGYGTLNWPLDTIERWAEDATTPDMFIGRNTVRNLCEHIRELETERDQLEKMEDAIQVWQSMDAGRNARIDARDEAWEWRWYMGSIYERRTEYGRCSTYREALCELYQSLVDVGEVTP